MQASYKPYYVNLEGRNMEYVNGHNGYSASEGYYHGDMEPAAPTIIRYSAPCFTGHNTALQARTGGGVGWAGAPVGFGCPVTRM